MAGRTRSLFLCLVMTLDSIQVNRGQSAPQDDSLPMNASMTDDEKRLTEASRKALDLSKHILTQSRGNLDTLDTLTAALSAHIHAFAEDEKGPNNLPKLSMALPTNKANGGAEGEPAEPDKGSSLLSVGGTGRRRKLRLFNSSLSML